jgi:hypothetical protein
MKSLSEINKKQMSLHITSLEFEITDEHSGADIIDVTVDPTIVRSKFDATILLEQLARITKRGTILLVEEWLANERVSEKIKSKA